MERLIITKDSCNKFQGNCDHHVEDNNIMYGGHGGRPSGYL